MPTRLSIPRLSFRWQIILLGGVITVLFIAVLVASLAALHYTKSSFLNSEKQRLYDVANTLVGRYLEEAKAASRARGASSVDFDLVSSPEALSAMSQSILQRTDGINAGFYKSADDVLLGSSPPPNPDLDQFMERETAGESTRSAVLDAARGAARTHQPAEKILTGDPDVFIIEAVPIRDGNADWGSAWTVERLQSLPGSNRLHAYLITVILGVAALACVILTLLVVRNLQAGVWKIEEGLQRLELDLASQISADSDPEEIQRIALAINRLGTTLKENIGREKQIEDRLRHSERLAGLGRLVAGVAHEVRNPLATIRLRVQMAQRDARNPAVDESCAIALEEIERLNGMVNRLLNFARPIRLRTEPTNLNQLTEQRLTRFIEKAEHSDIHIVTNFAEDGNMLPVDRSKMAQVFDNIIQNAIEAMTESGGTLWVSVTSEVKSVSGADKVRVEFRDTGNGIKSNMISRIFDPFFTTKPAGTGLGLSICHELVRAHGGEIQVESGEGNGTSVRVILPIRDSESSHILVS